MEAILRVRNKTKAKITRARELLEAPGCLQRFETITGNFSVL